VQARHEWWEDFFGGPWGELQAQGYPEARTHAETDFLVTALALVPGQQVLDLACGNGRHSIEMARRGMTVTGVDFNRNALATASRKAAENGVDVSFVEADMRAVEYEGTFDAAFSFFTSFGYFEDESDDLLVAQRIAAALKPGGRFVLETMSLETLLPVSIKRAGGSGPTKPARADYSRRRASILQRAASKPTGSSSTGTRPETRTLHCDYIASGS
jgi:2-polyprenyl-3-methyl-5-hydroxy-6-metoxy-1,4-benzoquinol methylase